MPTPRAPGPSLEAVKPSVAARAERLRVGLAVFSGDVTQAEALALAGEQLSPWDWEILAGPPADDDLHLLNACLALEAELRAAQYRALGRLLGSVAPGEGEWGDRLVALPRPQLSRALLDLMALHWWHPVATPGEHEEHV
jgi:hypothetical protein